MKEKSKIAWSLFSLRIGIFIVMIVWTLDKFTDPAHASKVFEHFYMMENLSFEAMYVVGALQFLLILAFVFGYKKRLSYGGVFLIHAVSTFSSWHAYLDMKLLFFAAWPMLAACLTLYMLRELDTKFTVS
jgi:hypothetical protein